MSRYAFAEPDYVAAPKDQSLVSLISETLLLMELRFKTFDVDGAGKITFEQLQRGLSIVGFCHHDEMQAVFVNVDTDRSGTLDFSEFFALIYLWAASKPDGMNIFFSNPTNREVVTAGFKIMVDVMRKYDADNTRRLSRGELDRLFNEQFPNYVSNGLYQQMMSQYFPAQADGSKLKGTYIAPVSSSGNGILAGFKGLEADFVTLDVGKNGSIDISELCSGINMSMSSSARVDLVSRLCTYFRDLDEDNSECLDFFEFSALGYYMSMEGSYMDFCKTSQSAPAIKSAFNQIYTLIKQGGSVHPPTFSADKLREPVKAMVGAAGAAEFDSVFASVSKGKATISLVELMKVLYRLSLPTGSQDPAKLRSTRKVAVNEISQAAPAAPSAHPPRINPVVVSKFRPIKVLGEGGQGKVCLGTYDGIDVKVAGKTFKSAPGPEQMKEVLDEAQFFIQLSHPNCHYMIGAKTTPDQGGILMLTEVCDNGSLFDMYFTKHIRIGPVTAWRFSKECAQGFEYMHGMGYMHRDIKSLNVFVTKDLVCQVADFGMATNQPAITGFAGTGQWAAPEVGHHMFNQRAPPYDKRCDVYSYGILLWEIFHNDIPYADTRLDQPTIVRNVTNPHQLFRPRINPARCPPPVQQLLAACWAYDPRARPSFTDVIKNLDALRSTIPGA